MRCLRKFRSWFFTDERQAIRQGVREGLAPLGETMAQVGKTFRRASEVAAELRARRAKR